MYREKIREYYDHLSRSYRKVADYIMSNYYEVSFMTAAQLAYAVGVDTTTVVRFSQRLGYNGYPELLSDIRSQVKLEIYAAYEPQELTPDDPAKTFKERAEQEQHNLKQTLVHNPPDHVRDIAGMLEKAEHIVFFAEGYSNSAAQMAAEQLNHRGVSAELASQDQVKRSATLMRLTEKTLAIGMSATAYGEDVARALEYARQMGAPTLGIVGSLASPVNRMSDQVMYAPTDSAGPLPSIVALVAATSALVQVASKDTTDSVVMHLNKFTEAYQFMRRESDEVPDAIVD